MDTKDGELPAFGHVAVSSMGDEYGAVGISRREYFAAAALTGIIMRSTNDATAVIPRASNGAIIDRSRYADTAFQYADAMIAQERGTSK